MTTENQNPVPEEQVSAAEDVNMTTLPEEVVATVAEPAESGEPAVAVAALDEEPVAEENVVEEEPKHEETVSGPETVSENEESEEGETAEESADSGKMDFSEEEAGLDEMAADAPEFDLGEHHEEETATADGAVDFSGKTKSELLDIFAELLSSKPVQILRRDAEAIKVAFYKLHRAEVDELRRKFIEGGGTAEDFTPPVDNDEQRLKDLFGEYRKRRDEYIANIERSKEDNLKAKLAIIEELKELVNTGETVGKTFNAFRDLQQRWRDTGPVPQANLKDLWDTYNHHVENFYSYIKINKELRDLDLKRNYEAKIALCEEAEALIMEPSVVNAFHKLQKLHDQWRETGPVANEFKESLWDRFREASSRINKAHQEYFESLKDEQKRNLDLKTELCVKAEELVSGVLTSRRDWNKASEKLLGIQKVWKTIGFAPKKDNARVYERFRAACDRFFEQKRAFYLQLKTEMEHNMELKNEICAAAEALQDSEDWKKTSEELIDLQKRWKDIGPVARRHSDAVWKRFRAACDRFFERKSQHFSVKDSEHEKNLELKRALLDEIRQADIVTGGFDMIKAFQRRWSEIGYVPIRQKDAIQKEYKQVMDEAFTALRASGQGRQMDRFRDRVENMKGSGDRRLRNERDKLYNKVKQLESEIALLENNIGFFSNSKNAESMIRDVRMKIDRAREEMATTIEKINMIDKENQQ